MNSTSDQEGPTIVTSVPVVKHAVQDPIGTKASSSSVSPVQAKAWFTTDVDGSKPARGQHFMLIQELKEMDLEKKGILGLIETTVSCSLYLQIIR